MSDLFNSMQSSLYGNCFEIGNGIWNIFAFGRFNRCCTLCHAINWNAAEANTESDLQTEPRERGQSNYRGICFRFVCLSLCLCPTTLFLMVWLLWVCGSLLWKLFLLSKTLVSQTLVLVLLISFSLISLDTVWLMTKSAKNYYQYQNFFQWLTKKSKIGKRKLVGNLKSTIA